MSVAHIRTGLLSTLILLFSCSAFNREGPNVTCSQLQNGTLNACQDGIVASCEDGNHVSWTVCDDDDSDGGESGSDVCGASWQMSGRYRCDESDDGGIGIRDNSDQSDSDAGDTDSGVDQKTPDASDAGNNDASTNHTDTSCTFLLQCSSVSSANVKLFDYSDNMSDIRTATVTSSPDPVSVSCTQGDMICFAAEASYGNQERYWGAYDGTGMLVPNPDPSECFICGQDACNEELACD